ncbi:phage tail protein [Bacillus cereus group sp. N34]|uniref:phage tail spike protein n=1 Tax=Bacillus cereus group sp. N34 TaxID=2794595 RepID=UPI0018F27AAA|nr:phage tail spike protein [Bacillus cereus group sp. N34]MBJ8015733.1 phage tail protein [Bacillus cereus group sp. N34]
MRTPSGELHVVDFKTEQIVASIQPKDYRDDKRHWEIKNNIDTLEFRVFDNAKHSATLMQQNSVLKEVRDGRIVPYVITAIEKDSDDRSVIAYASGEWVQLAKAGIIPPQKLEGKTVIEMVDIALAGTKWQKGNLEYASFRSMTIDEFIDPLTLLKKIASLFELEIQYRAEVIGSKVVGRYVDMIKKRGRETGKEVTLDKDLMGIKRIENSQNICTALLGFVKKEGGEFVTITEINNGVPYLVDSDAFQRWSEKGQHKFGFYSPETEDQDMNPKRLMTLMNTELKKRVNTSVSYEVQAQSIGRVFGFAHELINEGDTIKIKDTGFTPKLYLEARVIAGDESFTDSTQDKYVFGDYREIVDPNEELRKIYNRILSSLGNKQEMLDQLDKLVKEANEAAINAKKESEAAKTLAEKVQENIKNNTVEIIEAKNPPTTGLKDRKTLWLDISNGKPGILKLWKDGIWDPVVPDVEKVKKETLEQVNKDIESTKNELNKKVQEAQNQATGQVNEVKESLQGVSRTISDVQNKQGEIDKKVTKFEQDSSGFKTSIESLTKKDGEISGKLNTVEQTVEGTKKTISDVQQTANDLKKTTTEITEQAGKINEKLTSVETKVNNDKAGGRNLALDSNVKYEKTDYLINQYSLTENFSTGEEYTFVIKGSAPQGQKFGIWQNGGSSNVGYATSVYANGITYVTFKAVAATSGNERKLSLYNSPSNTTKATVEWVALYKGNKPQDWTPAPENQVTNDEFTKKTNEITKSVDGIKETITKVENNQSGFDKRVATVEKDATTIKQNVSLLQDTQTAQGRQLQEAKAGWENTAKALEGKVEIKQVEDYVAGFKIPDLKNTVNKNKEDLLAELANKLATEQFNQKVTQIDNRFIINERGINAAAKTTEVYTKEQANGQFATSGYVRDMESRLQLTEKGVSISVKENDVIAAFNMSKENIKLNAARIDLVGKVNADWIKAGLLSGCQIRTSNTNNYVSLDDQFLRLYESGVPRAFLGYYRRRDGAVQPTFILGSDEKTSAPEGTLFISQMGTGWPQASANIGITDDIVDSEIRKSVFWELNRNGISVLHANDYHALYAGNGNWYFRRGKSGLYQSTLAIEDNSSDADLRLPNITLRNSRVAGYTGVLQVKSSVTQNGWGAVQGNFMSPSLREYKSNIRDVAFSALEKIRNLRIRQFNYKNAVNELYRMREEKDPNDPPLTKEAIKTYYGAIVDESDEAFVDESGKGIHLYSYVSLTIKALQEHEENQNEKIQEMERKHNEEITLMNNKIATLETLVQKLIDEKPEQQL